MCDEHVTSPLVRPLVCHALFSELALRIYLIFCMKLGEHKWKKVTEPDFLGKLPFCPFGGKSAQNRPKMDFFDNISKLSHFGPPPWRQGPIEFMPVCPSVCTYVCNTLFSELALRIYLKLCKVGGYKGSKVTESDFPEKLWNSRSGVISAEKCWKMDSFRIFFKTALRILVQLEI